MLGMMVMMVMCMMLLTNLTPLNLALTLTTSSLVVSALAYSTSMCVFPSAMILISFSSGTMILFCYCAMMTNYIQKSSQSLVFSMMMLCLMPMMMSMSKMESKVDNLMLMKNLTSSMSMCMAMSVVILSMVCINKSMYKKDKPLKMSY